MTRTPGARRRIRTRIWPAPSDHLQGNKVTNDLLGDRLASSAKGVKSRSLVVKEVVIEEVVGEGGGDHGDGDRRDAL
jgi:hypothetical protein